MTQDIPALIATAKAMREQLGDDYPKSGSILDLWFRTADALEAEHQRVADATSFKGDLASQRNRAYRQRDEERAAKEGNLRALNNALAERDRYHAALVEIRDYLNEGRGCWTPDLVDVLTVLDETPNRPDGSDHG